MITWYAALLVLSVGTQDTVRDTTGTLAGTVRDTASPPIRGLDSISSPSTTQTAPDEMSWSCQPVSLTGVQHSNQTSTWSSRYSDTKWRS